MLDVFHFVPERRRIRLVDQYLTWRLARETEDYLYCLRTVDLARNAHLSGPRPLDTRTYVFDEVPEPLYNRIGESHSLADAYEREIHARRIRSDMLPPGYFTAGTVTSLFTYSWLIIYYRGCDNIRARS